jgi:hypothetical protein
MDKATKEHVVRQILILLHPSDSLLRASLSGLVVTSLLGGLAFGTVIYTLISMLIPGSVWQSHVWFRWVAGVAVFWPVSAFVFEIFPALDDRRQDRNRSRKHAEENLLAESDEYLLTYLQSLRTQDARDYSNRIMYGVGACLTCLLLLLVHFCIAPLPELLRKAFPFLPLNIPDAIQLWMK